LFVLLLLYDNFAETRTVQGSANVNRLRCLVLSVTHWISQDIWPCFQSVSVI